MRYEVNNLQMQTGLYPPAPEFLVGNESPGGHAWLPTASPTYPVQADSRRTALQNVHTAHQTTAGFGVTQTNSTTRSQSHFIFHFSEFSTHGNFCDMKVRSIISDNDWGMIGHWCKHIALHVNQNHLQGMLPATVRRCKPFQMSIYLRWRACIIKEEQNC